MSAPENSTAGEGNPGPTSTVVHVASWAAVASMTATSLFATKVSSFSDTTSNLPTPSGSVDALQFLTTFNAEAGDSRSVNVDSNTAAPDMSNGFSVASTPSALVPRRRAAASAARHEGLFPDLMPLTAHNFKGSHLAGIREHRALAIHRRRATNHPASKEVVNTNTQLSSDSTSSLEASTIAPTIASQEPSSITQSAGATQATSAAVLTPAQQAIQRGFSDGFVTAKMFAQQGPGMSRLGFKWQYVEDSLAAHGPSVIQPGKEGYYREWFDKGLLQGEAMVEKVIAKMNAQS
jgi:hypothetical protein